MTPPRIGLLAGAGLLLASLLLPSTSIVAALRPVPAEESELLLLGATLFRLGLALLGVLAIVYPRLPLWESPGIPPRPSADLGRRRRLAVVAGILGVAAGLRLYGLDAGLWYDEIVTYMKYVRKPLGEIVSTYDSENQHLLYSVLARLAFSAFGEGAWALRLPAAVFGVASIWALYRLGREVARAREALLAAGLLAVSYHHIWFSQNARGYTGLLFWTLLSSWLLVRALRGGPSRLWLGYAVAVALGVATHLTMLFVVGGQFVMYLLALARRRADAWPHRWVGLLVGFGGGAVLTFQLHALVLPQIVDAIERTESVVPAWKLPVWTAVELTQGLQVSFAGSIVAAAALVVCGLGVWSYLRWAPAVIQLLLIPSLVGAALVVAQGHHLWPRFFFFAFGFAVLVVVRGAVLSGELLTNLLRGRHLAPAPLGVTLALGLILFSTVSVPAAYAPKQDYAGALAFVEARKKPGDAIVTVGLTVFPYRVFYARDWPEIGRVADLDSVRAKARRTWLLYTLPTHLRSVAPDVMAAIQRDFGVVARFPGTLGGGTIIVCLVEEPRSVAEG